jgi:hypothetical protein
MGRRSNRGVMKSPTANHRRTRGRSPRASAVARS